MAEINLGCTSGDAEHTYRVYVTTYLGFGANAARKTYEEIIFQQNKQKEKFFDPCLPVSMKQNISGLIFIGSGKFDDCYNLVRRLLNETAPCPKVNSGKSISYTLADKTIFTQIINEILATVCYKRNLSTENKV